MREQGERAGKTMEIRGLSVAVHNLGCKVNAYEAEAMLRELENAGARIVPWEERADIYLINTCSVTNIADKKSRQMLHRARAKNPDAIVVGTGCYVQARKEELLSDGSVDLLIGNAGKGRIAELLSDYLRGDRTLSCFDLRSAHGYEEFSAGGRTERARAFLKVQDGCGQFCSYCIIPYLRGDIRSRALPDILREVRELSEGGYREIVLTGIHLSSYGMESCGDRERRERAFNAALPSESLLSLIREAASVSGIERVRLGSLEPRIISRDFVRALSGIPEFCPHFHLSLQSGSDRTLRAMNRHYDSAAFRESAKIIRESFPDAALTTDVIVGFPGETEEDFSESLRFISEIGFYELHVFKYSRRRGTAAERMKGQVPEKLKAERSARLIALDRERSAEFRRRFLGRQESVLLEERIEWEGRGYLAGFNREYVRFLIPCGEAEGEPGKVGEIISALGEKLCGRYVLAKAVQMR